MFSNYNYHTLIDLIPYIKHFRELILAYTNQFTNMSAYNEIGNNFTTPFSFLESQKQRNIVNFISSKNWCLCHTLHTMRKYKGTLLVPFIYSKICIGAPWRIQLWLLRHTTWPIIICRLICFKEFYVTNNTGIQNVIFPNWTLQCFVWNNMR